MLLATTDDSGAWSLENVPAGTWTVAASAPGFALAEAHGVAVAAGQRVAVGRIDLPPASAATGGPATGAVSGLAAPLGAQDASGVSVTLAGNGLQVTSLTLSDGSYSFTSVPIGFYTLSFALDGYSTQTIVQAAVLPGLFVAPPVTLYPGTFVSAHTLTGATSLSGTRSLLSFEFSSAATYDWTSGALGPVVPVGYPPTFSPDGNFALDVIDGVVVEARLTDGALTPRARVAQVLGVYGGRMLFADPFGAIASIAPGDPSSITGPHVPCAGVSPYALYAQPLTLANNPIGGWATITVDLYGSCTGYSYGSTVMLVDARTARASRAGTLLSVLDDASAALMLANDDNGVPSVYRIDLITGAEALVRANVSARVVGTDAIGLLCDAPTNSVTGTLSRLDLHTGAFADLLQGATISPWPFSLAMTTVAQAGTPAAFQVVHFDAGAVTQLCPVANSNVWQGYGGTDVVYCTTTPPASTSTIVVSNAGAPARTLTTGATGYGVSAPTPHTALWQESDGIHLARIDSAATPLPVCGQPLVSANENVAVAACTGALTGYDLLSGTQSVAATLPGAVMGFGISPTGRALTAVYAAPPSGAYACGGGATSCLIVFDRNDSLYATMSVQNVWGQISAATATDSGVFISSYGSTAVHAHLRDDGPRLVAITGAPWSYTPLLGSTGRCVVAGAQLADADTGTVVPTPSTAVGYRRVGATDEWRAGDDVLDLARCSLDHLGTDVQVLGQSPAGQIVYRDASTAALLRYSAGGQIATIAQSTQRLNWTYYPSSAVAHVPVAAGTGLLQVQLIDVTSDGTVRTLIDGAAPQLTPVGTHQALAYANPDLTSGDAVLIDLDTGATAPLHARVSFQSPPWVGVLPDSRVAFNGRPGSASSPLQLLLGNADGSNLRSLGAAGYTSGTLIAGRLLYQSGGLTFIDSNSGRAPLAIDVGAYAFAASPDGAALLFGGSGQHAGTWRVALP